MVFLPIAYDLVFKQINSSSSSSVGSPKGIYLSIDLSISCLLVVLLSTHSFKSNPLGPPRSFSFQTILYDYWKGRGIKISK